MWLGNLGECYADLGQTDRAIEHYQQALAIAHETGNRYSEGVFLGDLGSSYLALGQTERAAEHYQRACEIGDEIKDAQVQAEARLGLAQVHLYREEWRDARQIAEAAPSRGYQPVLTQVLVALGTAHLREGNHAEAGEASSAALSAASTSPPSTGGNADVLYAKGVASVGQAVIGQPEAAQAARRTLEQAVAVAPAPGFRARALWQLDLLASVGASGVLREIRRVLADEPRDTARDLSPRPESAQSFGESGAKFSSRAHGGRSEPVRRRL